jgi:hypothetical protein
MRVSAAAREVQGLVGPGWRWRARKKMKRQPNRMREQERT